MAIARIMKGLLMVTLTAQLQCAIGLIIPEATESIQSVTKFTQDNGSGALEQRNERALVPTMEMLDPRRQPKPKPPTGNDIGMARIRSLPDHIEATVSIGYTMDTNNASQKFTREEELAVSREMRNILDSVPTMSLPSFAIEYHKDPEQEAINQRITEVARQLTEAALRKEYENGQLHMLPLPDDVPRTSEQSTSVLPENDYTEDATESATEVNNADKSIKSTRSMDISKAHPLIANIPLEGANMQLIAEVPTLPYMVVNEGFLPSPDVVGPLLGGPPLSQGIIKSRSPKQLSHPRISTQQQQTSLGTQTIDLPSFLKIVSPRYKLSANDLVVSVPSSGPFLQGIISRKRT